MLREVQFPMHTQTENAYRGTAFAIANLPPAKQRAAAHAIAGKTAKQRADVRLILDSQLPRARKFLEGSRLNTFRVTLTRIAVGTLDDDNLRGAMKGVRDEIAAWVGLDDRDSRLRFAYLQQTCPRGYYGVKITIEDDDAGGDVRRVVGAAPAQVGTPDQAPDRGRPGARAGAKRKLRAAPKQAALPFLRAYALLPWEQDGTEDAVLTELPQLTSITPPEEIRVAVPRAPGVAGDELSLELGTMLLRRERLQHPELGDCWLYSAPGAR